MSELQPGNALAPNDDSSAAQMPGRATRLLIGFAALTGILAVASANMVIDLDLFHEMALFREMLQTGTVPDGGAFAYTPTRDMVVHHEWATGAVLYLTIVSSGLGLAGLMILKYALTFSIGLAGYRSSLRHGGSFLPICVLAVIALCVGGYTGFTNVRAQMFTLLFLALQYNMMARDMDGDRTWIFVWPVMILFWANLHAGVVAGLGIFLIYVGWRIVGLWLERRSVGETFRRGGHLLAMLVCSPLILCANPWGPMYIPYLIRAVGMERKLIGEWQPLWRCGNPAMIGMFLIALLIFAAAVMMVAGEWKRKTKKEWRSFPADNWKMMLGVAFVGLTAVLALRHIRHVSIFAVTWIVFAPGMLMRTELKDSFSTISATRQKLVHRICVGVAMIAIAISVNNRFGAINIPEIDSPRLRGAPIFPVSAVNFLQQQKASGNMMVPFAQGAYVTWRMHPAIKVSIDSRYEVAYPQGAVEEAVAFYRGRESWKATLEKYPTDMVLVPLSAPVHDLLAGATAAGELPWAVIYQDESYAIFSRRSVSEPGRELSSLQPVNDGEPEIGLAGH